MEAINIYEFCSQLRESHLDEQISDLDNVADAQLDYVHPLKLKTVSEQHALGAYNKKAIELLKQLKAHIENGP